MFMVEIVHWLVCWIRSGWCLDVWCIARNTVIDNQNNFLLWLSFILE